MRGRKIEVKIERLFRDREDVGREGAEDGKKRLHKGKKAAEPVVTLLKKTKHTQVNYYPYKSLTTACSHNYNSHQLFVTSAEDELGNTDSESRRWGGGGEENGLLEPFWREESELYWNSGEQLFLRKCPKQSKYSTLCLFLFLASSVNHNMGLGLIC